MTVKQDSLEESTGIVFSDFYFNKNMNQIKKIQRVRASGVLLQMKIG